MAATLFDLLAVPIDESVAWLTDTHLFAVFFAVVTTFIVVLVASAVVALHLGLLMVTALPNGLALSVDPNEVWFARTNLGARGAFALDLGNFWVRTYFDGLTFAEDLYIVRNASANLRANIIWGALSLNLPVGAAVLDRLAYTTDLSEAGLASADLGTLAVGRALSLELIVLATFEDLLADIVDGGVARNTDTNLAASLFARRVPPIALGAFDLDLFKEGTQPDRLTPVSYLGLSVRTNTYLVTRGNASNVRNRALSATNLVGQKLSTIHQQGACPVNQCVSRITSTNLLALSLDTLNLNARVHAAGVVGENQFALFVDQPVSRLAPTLLGTRSRTVLVVSNILAAGACNLDFLGWWANLNRLAMVGNFRETRFAHTGLMAVAIAV